MSSKSNFLSVFRLMTIFLTKVSNPINISLHFPRVQSSMTVKEKSDDKEKVDESIANRNFQYLQHCTSLFSTNMSA